eukprot:scaffold34407_cov171-Skeletonema_menzelii.AAC.2
MSFPSSSWDEILEIRTAEFAIQSSQYKDGRSRSSRVKTRSRLPNTHKTTLQNLVFGDQVTF